MNRKQGGRKIHLKGKQLLPKRVRQYIAFLGFIDLDGVMGHGRPRSVLDGANRRLQQSDYA